MTVNIDDYRAPADSLFEIASTAARRGVTNGIQRQHLDYYLDEFTFRFNRRRSYACGLLFHRLAQQAVAVGPATYSNIINHIGSSPKKQV